MDDRRGSQQRVSDVKTRLALVLKLKERQSTIELRETGELRMAGHESLRAYRKTSQGSNRNFGLVFAGFFTLVAILPVIRHGEGARWWAVAIGIVFLVLALVAPEKLAPLNHLWFKLGLALHGVVSPVIMGLLFFAAVLPFAAVLRLAGKDLLRLNPSDAPSYWIRRDPPGPSPGSLTQQF